MITQFEYTYYHFGAQKTVLVTAEGYVDSYIYGADADGKRGERREDVEIKKLTIEDENGDDITNAMMNHNKFDYKQIEEKVEYELYEAYKNPSDD